MTEAVRTVRITLDGIYHAEVRLEGKEVTHLRDFNKAMDTALGVIWAKISPMPPDLISNEWLEKQSV